MDQIDQNQEAEERLLKQETNEINEQDYVICSLPKINIWFLGRVSKIVDLKTVLENIVFNDKNQRYEQIFKTEKYVLFDLELSAPCISAPLKHCETTRCEVVGYQKVKELTRNKAEEILHYIRDAVFEPIYK